ncbi:MAG TPA: class I SAM-dependent methyltransferase [Vicinamibacterales bacterium]|nr:class I SAM-dependent methyltransferase [Vicinamibacterales bacterium]
MTTETADQARARAASTYNAAADAFDDVQNTFWDRFGRRTVARLDLRPGARVLDVCCGTGASALPAAAKVGPSGLVIGVDLAERLLERARVKARHRGLSNVEFRTGDMLALDFASAHFDAVICVFGIFFVPDMPEAARELWRLVRPGGQLAITTWGPRFFEPANSVFWNAVRDVRPDLYEGFHPWDRITDPAALRSIFPDTSVERLDVVAEDGRHSLRSPEDWWTMVLGTGYRGTLEQLDADARRKVRTANLAFIREAGVDSVDANVVYAVASKAEA